VPAAIFFALADESTSEFAVIFVELADDSGSEPAVIFVELADAIPLKPADVFVALVSGADPELGAIFVAVTTELFAGARFTESGSDGLPACNDCESALSSARAPCHSGFATMADIATATTIRNTNAI
jgi:hypothetical protein